MRELNILIIGGGIGGLTSAIALARDGHAITIIEKDPDWSVYGVGIIQQSNVVRAMQQLGILDIYLEAGFGFDQVEVFLPDGTQVATIPSPKLVEGFPANVGMGRRALHKVLGDCAIAAGAEVRLGVIVRTLDDDGEGVSAVFSDGREARFDIVIGADGLYSATREMIFEDAAQPQFTGQSVWRYNFPRDANVVNLCAYEGQIGIGLVPLATDLMYMYVTTPEPGNPRYPLNGIASAMRSKLEGTCPRIAALAEQITDDSEVVYKPLEWMFMTGDWHKGRVVLLGDAVHATTPHLGQGAGMAIEDSIVLADELGKHESPQAAFVAFRHRRFERCRYIVEQSKAIGDGQIGKGPRIEQGKATHDMIQVVSQAI